MKRTKQIPTAETASKRAWRPDATSRIGYGKNAAVNIDFLGRTLAVPAVIPLGERVAHHRRRLRDGTASKA